MSMYLVANEHIRELAVFYANHQWDRKHGQSQVADANRIAKQLASGNLQSAIARYGLEHGLGDFNGLTVTMCDLTHPKVNNPLDILSMVACYDYQACEPEDYKESETCKLVRSIQDMAIRALPGFDKAIRDYTEETPPEQHEVFCLSDFIA